MKLIGAVVLLVCVFGVSAQIETFANGKYFRADTLFGTEIPFLYGHSAIMTTDGRLAMYSGRDGSFVTVPDVLRFDYVKLDDSLPQNQNIDILDRLISYTTLEENDLESRLSAAFGTYQDRYLVKYGGANGGQAKKDLNFYDTATSTWETTDPTGVVRTLNSPTPVYENHFELPAIAAGAGIDEANGIMYLFGGDAVISILPYITAVDLTTREFTQLTAADNRRYGSVVIFQSSITQIGGGGLWILGGINTLAIPQEIYNDVFLYDVSGSGSYVVTPTTSGTPPSNRAYMGYAYLADGITVVLFGGSNRLNNPATMFSDVFRFNTQTGAFSTVVPIDNDGDRPTGRDRVVMVSLVWTDEDSVLIHGGSDQDEGSFNDLFKLSFQTSDFTPVDPPIITSSDSGSIVIPSSSSSSIVESSSDNIIDVISESSGAFLSNWMCLVGF